MKISVVIPIYGCRGAIPELYNRLTKTVAKITDDYELIFVNDNCPQDSWKSISDICVVDSHLKGINLSRNFGQMKAILAGLDYSNGDLVVVMDCDLQDKPEDILQLYQKVQEGYDIVFARRKERADGAFKKFISKQFYKVYRFSTDGNYDGELCNFSIVRREVINNYCKMREQHRGYVTYLKWMGFRQATVDIERSDRYEGKSSYNFKRHMNMALDLLTSQSDKVLRAITWIGLGLSIISLVVIIGLVIYHMIADVSVGWTSIIATMVLIGGIIIMAIGIVGVYIGNIFMQTKGRPLYFVQQILNDDGRMSSSEFNSWDNNR